MELLELFVFSVLVNHVDTFQNESYIFPMLFVSFDSSRFTGNVKLKGIVVIGGEMDSHPSKMKL
jgi:hypothetical protein